MWNL